MRALPEDERVAFEEYLSEHPELREEVEQLVSLANLLAVVHEEHEPPPRLRDDILSRIEREVRE